MLGGQALCLRVGVGHQPSVRQVVQPGQLLGAPERLAGLPQTGVDHVESRVQVFGADLMGHR